ncbi:MAG: TIGR02996 domain-containing protein [Zavarzinella sp.]
MTLPEFELAAHLKAICSQPDQDTPRLIFSDWLQDIGDPHLVAWAEFIRLSIDAYHAPDRVIQNELSEKAAVYANQFGEEWIRILTANRDLNTSVIHEFERGFPKVLQGEPVEVLKFVAATQNQIPVSELRLEEPEPIPEFNRMPGSVFPQIKTIHTNLVTGDKFLWLFTECEWPSLRKLTVFDHNAITPLYTLASAPDELLDQLNSLSIRTDIGVIPIHQPWELCNELRMAELKTLTVISSYFYGLHFVDWLTYFNAPKLKSFHLVAGALDYQALCRDWYETSLKSLTKLSLNQIQIARIPPHEHESFRWPETIQSLNLNHTLLRESTVEFWLILLKLPLINRLELNSCMMGDAGLMALLDWPVLSQLKVLTLDENFLTDESAAALATCNMLDNLQVISLKHNNFTNYGARMLRKKFGIRLKLERQI